MGEGGLVKTPASEQELIMDEGEQLRKKCSFEPDVKDILSFSVRKNKDSGDCVESRIHVPKGGFFFCLHENIMAKFSLTHGVTWCILYRKLIL